MSELSDNLTCEYRPAPGRPRFVVSRLLAAFTHATVFLVVSGAVLAAGVPGLGLTLSLAPTRSAASPASEVESLAEVEPTAGVEAALSAEHPPTPDPSTAVLTPTPTSEVDLRVAETSELRQREALSVVPTPAAPGKALQVLTYHVQPGDSLLAIALRFGVTPETILWANDLGNGELIRAGEDLVIPPVTGMLHKVQKGDTPASVAEAYVVDVAVVTVANGIDAGSTLTEGQVLVVPGGVKRTTSPIEGLPKPPSPEELAAAPKYTVLAGDSLVSIADAFGVRPSVIQVANDLMDPELLQVGQQLAIPGGKPGSAAKTPTPAAPSPTPTTVPSTSTAVPPTSTPQPASGGKYVVKAGDTVYSIARALGVQPQTLQDANGITDPTKVKVGQTLNVPGGPVPQPTATSNAAAPTPTATKPAAPAASATPVPPTATAKPAQTAPPAAPQAPAVPAAPAPQSQPTGNPANGQKVAILAQKYIGYRYVWGGHSPAGFDCSGFTWYVYREAGLNIPQHNLPGQLGAGPRIPKEQLAPGDLVFFQNTYTSGLSHVGIYLGGGRFINAETEKVGVQVRALADPYWSARFVGASRPW